MVEVAVQPVAVYLTVIGGKSYILLDIAPGEPDRGGKSCIFLVIAQGEYEIWCVM